MYMKNYLLYFAMFLLILCIPFGGNENEIRWLWAELIWVPLILIFTSLMCIARYLYIKESIKKKEVTG